MQTHKTRCPASCQVTPRLLPPQSLDNTQWWGQLENAVFVLATSHLVKNDGLKQEGRTNIQGQSAAYTMKGVSILHHRRQWVIEEFWGGEWQMWFAYWNNHSGCYVEERLQEKAEEPVPRPLRSTRGPQKKERWGRDKRYRKWGRGGSQEGPQGSNFSQW